ncbi:hypothetical protein BN1110_02810 [bacterium YEK0313]|nr:hypothetical protein BN1110_02810 [bacterium YEK0313]
MTISEDEEMALYEAFLADHDTRLIAAPKDDAPSVDFRFGGGWRECRIWEGYLDASLILLRAALHGGPGAHNLIFPALFDLRHGMEVALKWHIHHAGGCVPRRARHDLHALLDAFCETAKDLDDDTTYISAYMLNCISEMASIDRRSVAFRYSTETDGSPIEFVPTRWDLQRIYFAVDSLVLAFDALSNNIDLSRNEKYQALRRGK